MTDLIVVGGGEHARVVMDAAFSRPDLWRVIGFTDNRPCDHTVARMEVPRLGTDDDIAVLMRKYPAARFVVGVGAIGEPEKRERIVNRCTTAGASWTSIIHGRATVAATASIGEGTVVLAGAIVNSGSRIGNHCVINSAAVIEHDVIMGDFSQAAPAAAIGGGASVGWGSYLGLGSRIRDHVRVGDRVFVAMAAAVTHDVSSGCEVLGVPARPRKVNV